MNSLFGRFQHLAFSDFSRDFCACGCLASGMDRLRFELEGAIQALTVRHRWREAEVIRLTGLYHNLLRKWGEL